MANSSDSSGKGPPKPGQDAAPKKPSAILDLKPSGVDIRDIQIKSAEKPASMAAGGSGSASGPNPTSPSPSATSASEAAAAASGKPGEPASSAKPEDKSAASSTAQAKPADTKSETKTAGASSAPPKSETKSGTGPSAAGTAAQASPSKAANPPPARPPSSGGGLRSAATHLTAGIAGGLLALIGADKLAPELGLGIGTSTVNPQIEKRLAAIEATRSSPQPGVDALAKKLAAAEARLAALAPMEQSVNALAEAQEKLAAENKALAERAASSSQGGASDERLSRLEERLAALSKAAESDPKTGRIPQLAAITGRLVDLESSVGNQLAALRKSVTQEVESRLVQIAEASEAARTGTQRIDRDLASVKTNAAQLAQRLESLKSATDQQQIALNGLKDEANGLKRAITDARTDLSRELAQVARPKDVSTAVAPVVDRVAGLEKNIQGVIRSEADRKATAERIVMALELGNLKRTVERGVGFTRELAELRRVTGSKLDLGALERYKEEGVPSLAELQREFRSLAHSVIAANAVPSDASWTDRLLAGAKSIVRVRRTDQSPDDTSVEAVVARMEAGLKTGRLTDVVAQAQKLPAKAAAPLTGWLDKVKARAAIDGAIAAIERELKASLGAGPESGKKG